MKIIELLVQIKTRLSKWMKSFFWIFVIGLFHYSLIILALSIERKLFVDYHSVAIYYYQEYFLKKYGEQIGKNILCDQTEIFDKKNYIVFAIGEVEYLCANGKARVADFDKGFFRTATLVIWKEY